jgi:hypothetical protein
MGTVGGLIILIAVAEMFELVHGDNRSVAHVWGGRVDLKPPC